MESFVKVDKNKVIQACNNAIAKDNKQREYKRDMFLLSLLKPVKKWKFWPFSYIYTTRTLDQAEQYIRELEMEYSKSEDFLDYDCVCEVVGDWMYKYEYPKTLIKMANQSSDDFVYLCSRDTNFISENL